MDVIPTTTSTDVADRAPRVAVLPVGSFEQHGSFLPLSTDTIVASAIAAAIAERYNILLLPPITMSCSHEHAGWPGTVSISHQTLSAIVEDIRVSLAASGVTRLAVVNGHGGNYVLSNIVQTANATAPSSMTLFPTKAEWDTARAAAGLETDAHHDMHAGELEVSLLLHVQPNAVGPGYANADHTADERSMLLVHGMRAYTQTGVIGRPSAGTAEKGNRLLASLAESFGTHLAALGEP
ncbi:creatininase family protein [Dactylosporangium sp. NPDC048998]|uniref:creatininase family protein n=1 Tax=Dactylosporangium sp. NPDC048998 TaxID=3363976 RepID=UPI003714C064